ncbi:MAG TPA: ribonuclease HII [candidate division Zixibacteria bacterium]|nr:ribonuclease HII [candidate division Zixibacteria bacterium]
MKESNKKDYPEIGHLEAMLADQGYGAICGVDEAGRGPLAGPVVAAAVILPPEISIIGCTDSKKLTPEAREKVFDEIVHLGLVCAVGVVDSQSIDQMNILRASLMAMRKAVMELSNTPDVILVDGNYPIPRIPQPQYAIISGDSRCQSIAAASVVAKVTRDRIMDKYDQLYPNFSFGKHKGYPTADHLEELKKHGPCDIHRKSFKPVAELLESYALF